MLATSGRASGKLGDVFAAQAINRAAGGAVIAPWEIRDLPEEWLDVIPALHNDLSQARAGLDRISAAKAKYFQGISKH